MDTISPCKDCLNRFVGCHAECEKYAEWKVERLAANRDKYVNKVQHSNFDQRLRDRWLKSQQKKRR